MLLSHPPCRALQFISCKNVVLTYFTENHGVTLQEGEKMRSFRELRSIASTTYSE